MKPATTVTKVCRILAEFRNRPSLGVLDLARRTYLLPSDVHRILASLKPFGYIEQDPETKRYRLGYGLMRLGLTSFQQNILHSNGGPILTRISERLEAILQILERNGLQRITGRTITSREALESEFETIRQRGYALDREECIEGACCIASGVRDCTGAVIGALSASMDASRFCSSNQASLTSQVTAAATQLSSALGYDPRQSGQFRRAG